MKPLIIIFCLISNSLTEEGVLVKTGFGLINGKLQSSEPNNRKYASFLGIPYAKPPVGSLRFLPGEPINQFYGPQAPLQATEYKGDCAQLEIGSGTYKGSEDCLYLNVFTPDIHFTGENILPVLVWIHGGGFLIGGSDPGFYGPERWLDHNIVLVTFNYRLGALGFLSTGDGVAPPNNGLSDQQLVLAWVKENIQAFGGNANQVTIFGESAGGTSVMAHMSSPRSRGLFNQGIAMSGTFGFMNPLIHSSRPIQHYTSIMAAELSCDVTGSSHKTVSCLRNKTAEDIIRKANLFVRYNFLNNPFKPVVDADLPDPVLPHPLHDPWQEGAQFDVPLIIGGNKEDGIISYLDFLSDEKLLVEVESNFAVEGPVLLLSTDPDLAEKDEAETATAQVLKKKYLKDQGFHQGTVGERINMLTDVHFLASIDQTVKDLIVKKNSSTFYYNYQYKGSFSLPMAFGHMDSLGACQADQLFLMFRHEDVSKSWLGDLALQTEDDINVSNKLLEMLVEFAGTGKPSKDNKWKPAELDNLSYAVLDSREVRMEYPAVFAERMQLVQNTFKIIHKHRNLNMSEHPDLVQMQKDKEIFGQEEINKEINSDADWGIQTEAVEVDVEDVSEAGDKSEANGGDKPAADGGEKKANVEDVEDIFSLEKAMEMFKNWEAYASEEVKEIVKGIQKDGSFKVITDTLKNIKIETNKDEL